METDEFTAAAPPDPDAKGTGETSFSDADAPPASQRAVAEAEDDKRLRELAEARNAGESAAYQAEKQVKDLGEQIDSASKSEIEAAIAAVNEAVKGEDAEDIRAKTETLQTAFHKVSEAMYERAQAEQQASAASAGDGASAGEPSGSANGASADEEEVVDAEVVDEQK